VEGTADVQHPRAAPEGESGKAILMEGEGEGAAPQGERGREREGESERARAREREREREREKEGEGEREKTAPKGLALSRSIWVRQFSEPGLFSAPKLTNLHRMPSMST